ncbi:hypothetical protein MMC13_003372 [Lambiella insularis]|nr:hypothetical protein [Lambiella insularis]
MPPTRRKNGSATARAQRTISFNSRITKPSSTVISTKDDDAKARKAKNIIETVDITRTSPKPEEVDDQIDNQPTTAELAIRSQAAVEKEKTTEAEVKAIKITDAQIKRYWKKKEDERKAPRVHQQGLSLEQKILREFDLSSQFGPCVGIARTKRWNRARSLGLQPPIEVLAVLLKEDAKNTMQAQRAYVDELMAAKFVTN